MSMIEKLQQAIDLTDLLSQLENQHHISLWIMDNAYQLLGVSNQTQKKYLEETQNLKLLDAISQLNERQIEKTLSRTKSLAHFSPVFKTKVLIGDCHQGGQKIAKVTCLLNENSQLSQLQFEEILDILAIGLRMFPPYELESHTQSMYLKRLLTTNYPVQDLNLATSSHAASIFFIQPDYRLLILCSNGNKLMGLQRKLISNCFRQILEWSMEEMSVFLISDVEWEQRRKNVETVIQNQQLILYESLPFQDLAQAQIFYQQLLRLQTMRDENKAGIISFECYIWSDIFSLLKQQVELTYLLHPKIRKLISENNRQYSDYFLTLTQLLLHDATLKEHAQQLSVHLNTLKYRIQQLEDMFGYSLHEMRNHDWIKISCRIALYLKENESNSL